MTSRVRHRAIAADVASEADAKVLSHQQEFGARLTADELEHRVLIRTDGKVDWEHVRDEIAVVAHRA